ncbi:MAG: class I mannose-6-phosphate isomerase [Verrucomicrobiota bacterium]
MRKTNYDKHPCITLPNSASACVAGWPAIGQRLRDAVAVRGQRTTVVAIECYPGVDEVAVANALAGELAASLSIRTSDALRPEAWINDLCAASLGGDDPVFGLLCDLELPAFFDAGKLCQLKQAAGQVADGIVLIVGVGATLIDEPDILVYADLARWEIQQRQRRKEISNLGVSNAELPPSLKYKRAFFIDWRVADRWKLPLLQRADFFLDTHHATAPKLADGSAVRRGFTTAVNRPFRVVPFFDPGVWGGQWMKEVCDLDRTAVNYAWCFDCVPEENSILLGFGSHRFELPAIDLVFDQPRALLGERVHARFGAEFPIRFDFLDTMGGGNLSFQVHPLTAYIRDKFGMPYTQDESYYMLDAGPDATVYLGLKDGVDRDAMLRDLETAQAGGAPFPDATYVNRWPAKKHDHFLIPAGTVHCSGSNAMVLEISATPYIFTFKMWDWGRLGLDGKPRPIHLQHGAANILWERTTTWTRDHLVNRIETLGSGDGWREERTGLHESEFIETRRHWFTKTVPHDTCGNVHVLNLVEGDEIIIESPGGAFEPFVVHYAETFIVPAAVGPYTIRPHGPASGSECATLLAYVRA